jgi:hypothetical protein
VTLLFVTPCDRICGYKRSWWTWYLCLRCGVCSLHFRETCWVRQRRSKMHIQKLLLCSYLHCSYRTKTFHLTFCSHPCSCDVVREQVACLYNTRRGIVVYNILNLISKFLWHKRGDIKRNSSCLSIVAIIREDCWNGAINITDELIVLLSFLLTLACWEKSTESYPEEISLLLRMSIRALRPIQPPVQCVPRFLPGHKADGA